MQRQHNKRGWQCVVAGCLKLLSPFPVLLPPTISCRGSQAEASLWGLGASVVLGILAGEFLDQGRDRLECHSRSLSPALTCFACVCFPRLLMQLALDTTKDIFGITLRARRGLLLCDRESISSQLMHCAAPKGCQNDSSMCMYLM